MAIKAITEEQKEFEHPKFDTLVLNKSAWELEQDDVERWMRAYAASNKGGTRPETDAKTVQAAIEAGWIESPVLDPAMVGKLKPAQVRFYANCIDTVYALAIDTSAK